MSQLTSYPLCKHRGLDMAKLMTCMQIAHAEWVHIHVCRKSGGVGGHLLGITFIHTCKYTLTGHDYHNVTLIVTLRRCHCSVASSTFSTTVQTSTGCEKIKLFTTLLKTVELGPRNKGKKKTLKWEKRSYYNILFFIKHSSTRYLLYNWAEWA